MTNFARMSKVSRETQVEYAWPLPPFIPQGTCCRCSCPRANISLRCTHCFCDQCAKNMFRDQFTERTQVIRCPICLNDLTEMELQTIDEDLARQLEEQNLKSFLIGEQVECPNCHLGFLYTPGEVAGITKDSNGDSLSPQAMECLRKNRCTCVKCLRVFCVACKRSPYHESFTCEEQQLVDDGITCRFCERPVPGGNRISPALRTCPDNLCKDLLKHACKHVLPCGHACSGIADETEHFGCATCGYEQCAICGWECTKQPSIRLTCSHTVHLDCVKREYAQTTQKGRVIIPRCKAPGCRAIPDHPAIRDLAHPWYDIRDKIDVLTRQFIAVEGIEKERDHVNNPSDSDFYNKPFEYAQSIFAFFFCDDCHKPYYGGHLECGAQEAAGVKHCCPECSCQFGSNQVCPKHGADGMKFKCFFCCRDALFFCFGTTYFCEECHKSPYEVQQRQSYPQCCGCAFAPHPPNGTKQIWGYCSICQAERAGGV